MDPLAVICLLSLPHVPFFILLEESYCCLSASGGPDPTGTRAVPPARKLSASRVHDVATPDAVREEGDVAGTAEEQDNSRNLGKGLIDYSWEEVTRATKGFDASMLLGQGGFGKVYKGITATNQTVAIKVIRAHVLSQSTGSSDLKSEVTLCSTCQQLLLLFIPRCVHQMFGLPSRMVAAY